ncbi:hypothetical protein SUGI_0624210 [Cryptomeria japonica]|uniref:uncharacterized protein LOC131038304 n=1 Tax=Cryptomeria japonica TaxID=3369 RepID=UPI002414BF9C|nr:uncharacterized protein LOC131038304 [Cryptomeria japonica]GLJ31152.1 hypothetical protein SUGI_0624210 [Cryptomeria japonica]
MRKSDNDKAESSVRLDSPMESQSEIIEIRDSASPKDSGSYMNSDVRPTGRLQTQSSSIKAAPEKKLLVFAIRLALLEKAASGLGTLAFVWATVVLLGGFAIKLEREDFWFVTIILVIEGTRIFSRSRELEWQHETTLTMAEFKKDAKHASFKIFNAGRSFFASIWAKFSTRNVAQDLQNRRSDWARRKLKRSISASDNPLVQYAFSQNVRRLLFWAQLLSASTCIALSVWRLAGQDYGKVEGSSEKQNRNPALNVFYSLAVAEALLFLVEKAYWQWKIKVQNLLVQVKDEFGFDEKEVSTLQRFFYDTYSRCVNGSVFEGLKMDMVCFSVDLLKSSTDDGQLTGARVLSALVCDSRFSEETLRSIGIMQDVVERLLEMLNWKNRHEQEIRKVVAEIVCNFVKKNRNSLRVAQIPGALESIASLLYDSTRNEFQGYDYSGFSLLGLRILKNLATDHGNCAKIGSTKGLLAKIIRFTDVHAANLTRSRIKTLRLSLQLLKMLAASKGETGNVLRKEILKNVFTISNLREFLLYEGSDRLRLQILAIETLTSLALEEEGRESIGSTGGVLSNLFPVFFMERINANTNEDQAMMQLVSKAGEALTLLALHNNHNCEAMIKLKLTQHRSRNDHVIRDLIVVLNDPLQGVHAARILRNLCAYANTDCDELREITEASAQILKLVMEEQGELQEAAIGLAAQIFKFFNKSRMNTVFNEAGLSKRLFVMRLIEVLRMHPRPSIKVPYIRRFCIEVVICMVEKDKACFEMERLELKDAFVRVEETTSELESYSRLSGGIGLTRHHITIHSLVNTALSLLSS